MNRRSMFKAAIGACAAMLFPWRKVSGNGEVIPIRDPKCVVEVPIFWNRQIERIRHLIEQHHRNSKPMSQKARDILCEAARKHGGKFVRTSYCPTVRRCPGTDIIQVWWDEEQPSKDGLYGSGLVLITADVAASLNDEELTRHLIDGFYQSITGDNFHRGGLFEKFKGRAVCITRYWRSDNKQGVWVIPALYTGKYRMPDLSA